jgi:hypothetical protein
MRRLVKRLTCQPATVTLCPMLAGRIAAAMAKKESEQLLSRTHEVHGCIDSRSDQIPQCFMCGVWNPYRCQVSRAV